LYIGEGFHEDRECKLYCLDAQTGKKLWEFTTESHTESSPCVADGRVFFGAGDDGVYCLDAATGEMVWNYRGLHVDSSPLVLGKRLYAGSGVGDVEEATAVFCLNTVDGKEVWRRDTDLPAWGSPAESGDLVFFGLGNGNFLGGDSQPAGALLAVEA